MLGGRLTMAKAKCPALSKRVDKMQSLLTRTGLNILNRLETKKNAKAGFVELRSFVNQKKAL